MVPKSAAVTTTVKDERTSSNLTFFRCMTWFMIFIASAAGFSFISQKFFGHYKKVGLVADDEFSSEGANGLIADSTRSACYGATETDQLLQLSSTPDT